MTLAANAASRMLARLSGRLHAATLTQQAETAPDENDPTAAPSSSSVAHACEGYAFDYSHDDIDGTRVMLGDYRVVILRGTLTVLPVPGDKIAIPPPGNTVAKTARVVRVEAITEAQITLQVRG